jgi:hypothetical protein
MLFNIVNPVFQEGRVPFNIIILLFHPGRKRENYTMQNMASTGKLRRLAVFPLKPGYIALLIALIQAKDINSGPIIVYGCIG